MRHDSHPRRSPLLLTLLALVAIATPCALAQVAGTQRPGALAAPPAAPDRHVISVRLDPQGSSVQGTDELTFVHRTPLEFRLHQGLHLTALDAGGRSLLATVKPARGAAAGTFRVSVPKSLANETRDVTLRFAFEGSINDPVTEEASLHFVTGDHTTGLVVADGAFLTGGTAWYPETGEMALFDATFDVPEAWRAVSQGARLEAGGTAAAGRRLERFAAGVPSDGLAASAGPYVVKSVQHGPTRVSTYFSAQNAELADAFLEAVGTYLDRLEERLGPYPHPKFDVVENFFTTGYGFPSYTLLGQNVIAMGQRALRPGYVDHEVAHCWWGNHVYVDVSEGNWCEGLATYSANLLAPELESAEAVIEARRRISQRYSVDVPVAKDTPPAAFVEKTDDAASSIGYGKVAMTFHDLRRRLGDDAFWAGLRELVRAQGGQRASWTDVREAFERSSGQDLRAVIAQWVERADLPRLALTDVQALAGRLQGHVTQQGTPRDLRIELRVTDQDGTRSTETLSVSGASTAFDLPATGDPARLELDPDWHVARRLTGGDLPPSLQRTLAGDPAGEGPLCIYPEPLDTAPNDVRVRFEAYKQLAETAAEQHGGRAMAAHVVAQAEFAGASVLSLGSAADNPWTARLVDAARAEGVDLARPDSFRAGARRYAGADAALLASVRHPAREGATASVFIANGEAALGAARYVFFYSWDGWVAFEKGRARDRGTHWPEVPSTVAVLAPAESARSAEERLLGTVRRLIRPDLEGRDAGTPGTATAAVELQAVLTAAGIERLPGSADLMHPFAFNLIDVQGQPILFHRPATGPAVSARISPALFSVPLPEAFQSAAGAMHFVPPPANEPSVMRFGAGAVFAGRLTADPFAGLDLKDALAIVVDDRAPPAAAAGRPNPAARAALEATTRRHLALLDEARLRNAAGVLVVRPGAASPFSPALATFASQLDPAQAERMHGVRESGGERAVLRAIAGQHARTPRPAREGALPLLFGGDEVLEMLRAAGVTQRGQRAFAGTPFDARWRTSVERLADRNLLGRIPGIDPRRTEAILIGAHFDAVGLAADGTCQQGAVDNASGVAVLVEVARRLSLTPAAGPVVVAAFGAEEWGLQGSRALAAAWPKSIPLSAAVVIDSVGQAARPLHVIGRSRVPQVAAVLEEAAREAGFEIGRDIDAYADREGSDHWPFAEQGVAAVDLFQADYRVLNSASDTVDLLDAATLARLADVVEAAVRSLSAAAPAGS